MKAVITHTDFRLYWPARLHALSKAFEKNGDELHIVEIAGKGSPYSFAKGYLLHYEIPFWHCLFPHHRMESLPPGRAFKKLTEKLSEISPHVVLAGSIAFPSGAAAVHWAKRMNRSVIIFDNARLEDVPRSFIVNSIKRQIYSNVDAVICPAPSHVRSFHSWGVEHDRIFFGLNVVDNAWYAQRALSARQQPQAAVRQIGLKPGFFLGVGRLVSKKNWTHLILAYYETLQQLCPLPPLVLVGDGPERQALEELIRRLRLDDRVFLHGFVSHTSLCRYFGVAGALILPSRFGETWGLVVNEAMACGLPVLVSNECGCAKTLVFEGKNGFTFDPNDRTSIRQSLRAFASLNTAERIRFGIESATIVSSWSLSRFVRGAQDAIRVSVSRPKGTASIISSLILRVWKGRYRPV